MIAVPLDPHLLIIDPYDRKRVQRVTESVLSWSKLREYPQLAFCLTQKTLEALVEDDRLPVYSELIRILPALEFEHADAYTVAQTLTFFIANTRELETLLGISDVLVGPGFSYGVTCQCATIPESCAEAKRLLGIIALRQQLGFDSDIRLACPTATYNTAINARGSIDFADLLGENVKFPVQVNQQITACSNLSELFKSLNSLQLWLHAEGEEDLLLAINAAAEKIGRVGIKNVLVGPRFVATARTLHFDKDPGKASRLLDACAQVAANNNLRQIHAIRTSRTGNSPQLRHGTAKGLEKGHRRRLPPSLLGTRGRSYKAGFCGSTRRLFDLLVIGFPARKHPSLYRVNPTQGFPLQQNFQIVTYVLDFHSPISPFWEHVHTNHLRTRPQLGTGYQQLGSVMRPKTEPVFDAAAIRASILNIFHSNPALSRICGDYGKSQTDKSKSVSSLQGKPTKNFSRSNRTTNATNRTHTMPNCKTCTHIKITGHRCGSPALRGERFCYFHQHVHRGVRRRSTSRMHPIALFESEEALQVSLMEVVNALLYDGLDLKRATLILRALHIAVKNARRVRLDVNEDQMVTEVPEETPEVEQPLFHISDMELPISAAAVPDEDPVASQGNRIHKAYNRAVRTEEILQKEDQARRAQALAPAEANARPASTTARVAADAYVRSDKQVPAPTQEKPITTQAPAPARSAPSTTQNSAPRKPPSPEQNPQHQQNLKAHRASGTR